MAWVDVVAIFVTSSLELFNIIIIVLSLANKRKASHTKFDLLLYIIVSGSVAIVNIFRLTKVIYIICYIAIIKNLYRNYSLKIFESVIYFVIAIVSIGIIELIIYIPVNLFFGKYVGDKGISLIVVGTIFIFCIFIWRKRIICFPQNLIKDKEYKNSILLLIGIVVIFGAIFCFNFNKGMNFLEGMYLVIAASVIIYAMCRILLYRHELKIQKEYSHVYGNVVETIRQRQHKFMNQINAIYLMFTLYDNYDDLVRKQKEELDELKQYMMPNKILILEKPLIVAHVYQKMCEAKDNGIDLQMNLSCSMQEIEIPEIYLIEIIGNIFDNAMEAVLARGLQESIYLSIFQEEGKIHIQICNEHDKISFADYSQFFTTGYSTKGKNRGIGLPYVKKIVKKYKGEIVIGNVQVKDKNCFSVKVSFPI